MISDNGPPFKSNRVKEYMQEKGIKHRRIQPLWPQANGNAERFMPSLSKIVKAQCLEGKKLENRNLQVLGCILQHITRDN